MHFTRIVLCLSLSCSLAAALRTNAAAAPAAERGGRRSFYVELSDAPRWTLDTVGDYHCRRDARDLYCMYHLYSAAKKQDHAELSSEVTIPADWAPPFGLELFCSDDYQVRDDRKPTDGWMACHAYPHHRFKQILVDGRVVWEADVADPGVTGSVAVDITNHVTAGKAFRLTLRVIDKVGTKTRTDGEHFWPGGFTLGSWEPAEDPRAFPTHVYWGDLLVTERFDPGRIRPLREMPSVRLLRERVAQGELSHGWNPVVQPPGRLRLEAPAGAPVGWPLVCGVLLPPGAVAHAEQLWLTDKTGRQIAAQREAISWWPDRSLRAVRVAFAVPEGLAPGDQVLVDWDQARSAAEAGSVRVEEKQGVLVVRNDRISLHFSNGGDAVALRQVRSARGQPLAGAMKVFLQLEREAGGATRYDAVWAKPRMLAQGPRQATVQLTGSLVASADGSSDRLGGCTLRLVLTDGSPWVRTYFRLQNETPRHLAIRRLVIEQHIPPGTSRGAAATLEQPAGWFAADSDDGTVSAAVRWAAEMPTKRLHRTEDRLLIELFAPTERIPYYRPQSGEARRSELLLGYLRQRPGDSQLQAIARAVQRPPRLFSARWACKTAALGDAAMHDERQFARLTDNRRRKYGMFEREKVGHVHYDMRHFGDRRYRDKQWCNNYYDAIRGYLAEYLMTGNPQVFDRAAEMVSHVIDVDQCHWWPDARMIGGLWSYSGSDHSDAGYHWPPLQRTAAGLAYYYRLTGDPDVREALRMMADHAARKNTGYQSVRDHGGILTALVWAYDELGDERYLRAALETMADIRTRMSPRRGPYLEPNANWSFLVSIPWMAAELADAHYQLWRLTGNVDAAATALGLADSLIQENGTWGVPGELGGYSGYPHFRIRSQYHIIVAPMIGYGYEMTGDPRFLLWARACFRRTLDEESVDAIQNNYWLAPRLLYLLHRYEEVKTPMPQPPAERVPPNFGR